MKTTLFLSVSIDGLIADTNRIPNFPQGAWEDWCALVNAADNVIAGRSSFEQLQDDAMASVLHPQHRIVLSSRDIDPGDSGWQHARSPKEALAMLESVGVDEAIIGGGRAVAHSFMRDGLVDEVVIDLQPVAFGTGVPMFGDAMDPAHLELLDSHALNDNVLRLRYRVLRDTQH
ncbi:MAG: dihydrofolate reductase family protein [Gammaproteobacteria bacterium]|nr:dihydrofolate reductase family protein [Gammaproteobacteria bacterium]